MSGHCPKCGDYTEEDESRLCSGCASSTETKPMSTIDELRGVERRWFCSYCGSTYAEYCNGCPRCHHGEPGTATSLRACVVVPAERFSALLAVAEAARTFPGIHCDTEDAIKWASKLRSALARLDGEVGHG